MTVKSKVKGNKMKKTISILFLCMIFSGCSLMKIATAPFQAVKNSIPQSTEKSKEIIKCKGDLSINPDGTIICSKGFYRYGQNFSEQDRKLTLREKIGQFIAHGAGYIVWGCILAGLLTFFGLGWVVSGFFNIIFGVGKVLRQTVQGIQNARKNGSDLSTALSQSQDESVKKFIADFKIKNNIK